MKKTLFALPIAVVLLSMVSCTKEIPMSGNQLPATRTVTATFENIGTKTTLGANDRPLWTPGDKIRVLSSSNWEDITLADGHIAGDKVTFTLAKSHTGTLYAVYPASATTQMDCSNGEVAITVPAIQDGTFASANLCVAKGDDQDHLVFSNATAVLEFSQEAAPASVTDVRVSAEKPIAGLLYVTFDTQGKAVISDNSLLTGNVICTTPAATAAGKYYIAIAPVETGAVSITCHTPLQEASYSKNSRSLGRNKLYALTIPTTGFSDRYVEIAGKKWAKCNIGADNPSDAGWYFAWGYDEGCVRYAAGNYWVLASDHLTKKAFITGSGYFPYLDASMFKDAASVHWGSGWRVPTSQDFVSLCAACFAEWDDTAKGLRFYPAKNEDDKGLLHLPGTDGEKWSKWSDTDKEYVTSTKSATTGTYNASTDNNLFFPAAGYGDNSDLKSADANGYHGFYWSRDIVPNTTDKAYDLYFNKSYCLPSDNQGGARCLGYTVRPVAE